MLISASLSLREVPSIRHVFLQEHYEVYNEEGADVGDGRCLPRDGQVPDKSAS